MPRISFSLLATVIVGSAFGSATARAQCLAWDPTFGIPGADGEVRAMAVFDDGGGPSLIAAGDFLVSGNAGVRRIAVIVPYFSNIDFETLSTGINGGGTPRVGALAAFGGPIPTGLFAGGAFTSSGPSSATSIAWWRGCALPVDSFCSGDGTSVAWCPCANQGATGRGCANSQEARGAELTATGSTSPDSLVLQSSGEPASSMTMFLQGSRVHLVEAILYGDGLNCMKTGTIRLFIHGASNGTVSAPVGADLSITARSAQLGDAILPGSARYYQALYRDPGPFCLSNTFNTSNGVAVRW
jgi:hypothetical protein